MFSRPPPFAGEDIAFMPDRTFLDWPFLADHHRALARELETWCEAELAPLGHCEDDIDGQCRHLLGLLGRGGWLRYAVPASHGGVHEVLDVRSLSLIRETLARYSGLADFVFAMQGLGSGTISLFGTPEQKAAYLPAVAAGTKMAAFALTELDSGSDVAAMTTSARPHGNGWVVDGAKTYISNGGIADYYVLFARTGEAPGAKGISAFIVDADTPGLHIAERIRVIAPHPLATLRFDAMRLPGDALLGEAGRGCALDEATHRATTRRLQGKTLSENAVVQAMLAEMAVEIDASALLIYRAGWTRDVMGQRNSREAAMAKLTATDGAQRVIDHAVQIHGGLGVVHGHPVETLYREVRALRIYEGASEVQKMVIGRAVLAAATPAPLALAAE